LKGDPNIISSSAKRIRLIFGLAVNFPVEYLFLLELFDQSTEYCSFLLLMHRFTYFRLEAIYGRSLVRFLRSHYRPVSSVFVLLDQYFGKLIVRLSKIEEVDDAELGLDFNLSTVSIRISVFLLLSHLFHYRPMKCLCYLPHTIVIICYLWCYCGEG
jgi:hypothetical protein